jgi:hypothetical protein
MWKRTMDMNQLKDVEVFVFDLVVTFDMLSTKSCEKIGRNKVAMCLSAWM